MVYYIVETKYIGTHLDSCNVVSEATTLERAKEIRSFYKKHLSDNRRASEHIAIMQIVR